MAFSGARYTGSQYGAVASPRRTICAADLCREEKQGDEVTLVVVDMQPGWAAANDADTIAAVMRQVKLAISRGWAVVLLEVAPWKYGSTLACITDLLKGYQRTTMRTKEGAPGAHKVLEATADYWYPEGFFRVCGVNTEACVKATVMGLQAQRPRAGIRLIKEACNTDMSYNELWDDMTAAFAGADNVVFSSEHLGPFSQEGSSDAK